MSTIEIVNKVIEIFAAPLFCSIYLLKVNPAIILSSIKDNDKMRVALQKAQKTEVGPGVTDISPPGSDNTYILDIRNDGTGNNVGEMRIIPGARFGGTQATGTLVSTDSGSTTNRRDS